jgi:hypothetical protein
MNYQAPKCKIFNENIITPKDMSLIKKLLY